MKEKHLYCTDELLEDVMNNAYRLDFATPLEVEEFAKERNYIFGQDDMENCYLFLNDDCDFNCMYKLM